MTNGKWGDSAWPEPERLLNEGHGRAGGRASGREGKAEESKKEEI